MSKWLRTSLSAVVGVVALEVALRVAWPMVDDNDPVPGLEQQAAVVAVVTLALLPHLIALLARRRPRLLKAAGTVGIGLTLASIWMAFFYMAFALIFIAPLLWLLPSIFYLVASRKAGGEARLSMPVLVLGMLPLIVGASLSLLLTDDPRCTLVVRRGGDLVHQQQDPCYPSSSGRLGVDVVSWSGTDDAIALHESLLSLLSSFGIIALAVAGVPPSRP
ncbi:MAG TPA: hypothetical protein VIG64_05115, partial [Actinomycetota bacterium]